MSKPELYPIILFKAARYNYKDLVVTRGQIIEVSAKDRNWLVKAGHFKDYVKEEPLVLVDEPEMPEDEVDVAPKIVGRAPTKDELEGSVPVMTHERTTKRPGPRKGSTSVNVAAGSPG